VSYYQGFQPNVLMRNVAMEIPASPCRERPFDRRQYRHRLNGTAIEVRVAIGLRNKIETVMHIVAPSWICHGSQSAQAPRWCAPGYLRIVACWRMSLGMND
jgi:hypothetical protein